MSLTLPQRIEAASGTGGVTFIAGDRSESLSWAQLHEEARAMAAGLQARGVGPGERVALLGPTSRLLVTAILAVRGGHGHAPPSDEAGVSGGVRGPDPRAPPGL